jgi:hypothetical protein
MSISGLENIIGQWAGTNHLWLSPVEPVSESSTTMFVELAAQGQFVTLQYTWTFEGKPQDGLILIGYETQLNVVKAIWVDSFHMQDKFMLCQGNMEEQGVVKVKGSYAAPPGPDWGWQININNMADDKFQLEMYNITPEGDAILAVEATYSRKR